MKWLHIFAHLVWKDIRIESRGRQFLIASTAFGILLLFITGIALDAAPKLPAAWGAGLLWLNIFFTTAISLSRHEHKDRELGASDALRLIPCDRSVLYYAKWVSTCGFVLLAESVLVLAFFIIFNQPTPSPAWLFAFTTVGGTVGLTGVGTFLTAITEFSTMRDFMMPILLFPLTIPLFLACIKLTINTFSAAAVTSNAIWVEVLVGYFVVVLVLPWLLYDILAEVW